MIALSVNLNKIALIRNSRDTTNPDIPQHARMCIDAGADGITVHPRPDQRHIRVRDCFDLAAMLDVEFNIEGNPMTGPRRSDRAGVEDYPGFMALVKEIRPTQCTLVPDGDGQLTSDHGFDLQAGRRACCSPGAGAAIPGYPHQPVYGPGPGADSPGGADRHRPH